MGSWLHKSLKFRIIKARWGWKFLVETFDTPSVITQFTALKPTIILGNGLTCESVLFSSSLFTKRLRCKSSDRDLLAPVLSRLALTTCICLEFWLVHWIVRVCFDWSEWLLGFWFYDAQLETALFKRWLQQTMSIRHITQTRKTFTILKWPTYKQMWRLSGGPMRFKWLNRNNYHSSYFSDVLIGLESIRSPANNHLRIMVYSCAQKSKVVPLVCRFVPPPSFYNGSSISRITSERS